jgi:predicted alpha-1,2-mannosidase
MRLIVVFLLFSNYAFSQSEYVNPLIGTGGHGHTFPGATVPFGMIQLSPDTRVDGSWDGCSGYHYSDSFIYGFSHTHLSGTGVSDYGDVLLLPSMHPIPFEPERYKTEFRHEDEKAEANYYEVYLRDNGVKARLTTDTRTGIHQYIFDRDEGYVLLDLEHRDPLMSYEIDVKWKNKIHGHRISTAWAKEQHVYFCLEFDQYFDRVEFNKDSTKAIFHFTNLKDKTLEAYVGLSFVSNKGADKNLWEDLKMTYEPVYFDRKVKEGKDMWDEELSKIEVFTKDENKKSIFYTALYHCMMHPNIAEDVDGKYRGHDGKIHESPNHTHYTVFSLWDTYRAWHPLMTIIDEKRTTDYINTFLEIYKQSGRLPVWELAANETDCMIGYHAVSVIADAYMKGIHGFDTTLALEAMVASANTDLFGLPSYRRYGFIRAEDESESVSKTLEYAYDDWCIAQMAKEMGEDSLANVFFNRAQSWRNVLNPETGFATPRLNGDWLPNFDPRQVNNHFTEANSWQYSFVQQANGGSNFSEALEARLDSFFSAGSETTGRTQSDITGLIGQYAHGNEPSHHIAYLYNYCDSYNKTREIVNLICDSFYTNSPDGLIGNEDCGQMSAWYVLSSSGFYPIAPGSNEYALGSCQFDSVKYYLPNGNTILIQSVPSIFLHEPVSELKHNQLVSGIRVKTGEQNSFGKTLTPFIHYPDIVPTPLIRGKQLFQESTSIDIKPLDGISNRIMYYVHYADSSAPSGRNIYKGPFSLTSTATVYARAELIDTVYTMNGDIDEHNTPSPFISATFYKKPNHWLCTPSLLPNPQYDGGGGDALVDGIRGTENWKAGHWQGYQYDSVRFSLDFKVKQKLSSVSIGFAQDARSWILLPSKIEIYDVNGKLIGTKTHVPNAFTEEVFIESMDIELGKTIKAQNLEIKIFSAGKLPKGHPGHTMDGDAFFFIDEITVTP